MAILAPLAVDERRQGQRLGASLLNDGLERICRAAQEAPRTLMATLAELREAGYGR